MGQNKSSRFWSISKRYGLTHFWAPLIISAIILGLLVYQIEATAIITSVKQCNILLLLSAVFISIIFRFSWGVVKWRQILIYLGCRLSCFEILSLWAGCIPFKIVLPMKTSELLKALYLSRHNRLSFNRSISSLVFDKALNLFVVVCFALVGLMFTAPPFSPFIPVLLFLIITPLLFFNLLPDLLTRFVKWIQPGMSPVVEDLVSAFHSISLPEKFLLVALSFLFISSEFVNYFILFMAVGVTIPLPTLLLAVSAIMIISKLPFAVLGLGTREAAALFFFAAYGEPADLLSGSILISLVGYVLPILIGLFFIKPFLQLSFKNKTFLTERTIT